MAADVAVVETQWFRNLADQIRARNGGEMQEIVRPSYLTLLYLRGSSTLRLDIAIQCNSNNVKLIMIRSGKNDFVRFVEVSKEGDLWRVEMFVTINCKNFGIKCRPILKFCYFLRKFSIVTLLFNTSSSIFRYLDEFKSFLLSKN